MLMFPVACDYESADEYAAREQALDKCQTAAIALWNSPDHGSEYLEGTVTAIDGTLPHLVQSHVRGSETVKRGDDTYILHAQTPKGMYVVRIADSQNRQTVAALASAITKGTKIGFPTKAVYLGTSCYFNDRRKRADGMDYDNSSPPKVKTLFSDSKIGMVSAQDIRILSSKI